MGGGDGGGEAEAQAPSPRRARVDEGSHMRAGGRGAVRGRGVRGVVEGVVGVRMRWVAWGRANEGAAACVDMSLSSRERT